MVVADTLISLAVLIAAAALLLVVSSAESIVIYLNRSRTRALAGHGSARAETLTRYLQQRGRLLSTLRFGRNLALIAGAAAGVHLVIVREGTGWVPLAMVAAAVVLVAGLIEGIPSVVAARNPEHWGLVLSPIIRLLALAFWLPGRVLDLPGAALARLTPPAHTGDDEEDLLRLVEMQGQAGGIQQDERQMIRGVIKLVDKTARELMVPRVDIIAVECQQGMEDVQRIVVERGYSRIPLFEDTIDKIIGVIYAKDVLRHLADGTRPASLSALSRPPYFIPETKRVHELLKELQENKIHIAVVVDEYGGTAGVVTTEDIIEEIVGEIIDEYDAEDKAVEQVSEDEAIVDARYGIDALNDLFHLELSNEDYDTVGGIVYSELGKVPAEGDEVQIDGIRLHVLSVAGRRIKKIQITRMAAEPVET